MSLTSIVPLPDVVLGFFSFFFSLYEEDLNYLVYLCGYVGISNICGLVGVNLHNETADTKGPVSMLFTFQAYSALS